MFRFCSNNWLIVGSKQVAFVKRNFVKLYVYNSSSKECMSFVSTIFNEGVYLTFKAIFHMALKDGI